MKTLFNLTMKVPTFSWRSLFEKTRSLKGILLRVPLVISGVLSCEVGLCAVSFAREVIRLRRKSGLLFTALYLKQCSVCLQRYYAGSYRKSDSLSVPIGLTRSGIPTIIPTVLRKHIRARDARGDRIVKLYLSWFSLSKLVQLAPKVSKETFKSITEYPDNQAEYQGRIKEFLGEIKDSAQEIWSLYYPTISSIPLLKGIRWEPTWKSTPLLDSFIHRYHPVVDEPVERGKRLPFVPINLFSNLKHELGLEYQQNPFHSRWILLSWYTLVS